MKNRRDKCFVPKCTRDAHTLGLCRQCYQRTRYWHNKPMKQKIGRLRQIEVWESSLELQLGNVRKMKTKPYKKVANE